MFFAICSQFEHLHENSAILTKKGHFSKRSAHNPHTGAYPGHTKRYFDAISTILANFGRFLKRSPLNPRTGAQLAIHIHPHPSTSIYIHIHLHPPTSNASKIDNSVFFDPPGVKSHALNSFLVVPMSNSRILAQIPLASSCLGGNHEVKSIRSTYSSM